jgi:eukaryotic translation initiation factor 2C
VATQCMKSAKCFRAKPQYYANVCLKINVKLGGINTIPDPSSVSILTDPRNPTIVMGADVIHPAPGSEGRPSFTALVANVDSDTAKYIADSRVQTSRQEMIEDLQEMAKHVLTMYMRYREMAEKKGPGNAAPKRIIFYRDGVSEGQFQQVLDIELPLLKQACKDLNINPTITIILVGKRHHVRFFPQNEKDADRSGNCPAGTVVDREVAHPTEFDFYLQSHAGLLGTSRPAHYSILYDENHFTADGIQSLSFALCHVYARSTRSVSIPAPVYYADIVCARAKNHYDPQGTLDFSESATQTDVAQANTTLEAFKRGFKPLHRNMSTVMYFS